ECRPGCDLGRGEGPLRATHLPDAVIRLGPIVRDAPSDVLEVDARPLGYPSRELHIEMHCLGQLAEHIELKLVVRAISDPHGTRPAKAGQPLELYLGQAPLAANAIHDLQL